MKINETFSINAPIEKVWDFILDPKCVGTCIPGCEEIEQTSENEYLTVIKAKVGFLSVRFKVNSVIVETILHSMIRTIGSGEEVKKKGHFKQTTIVSFTKPSENTTEITYESDVNIVGRLAIFGDMVMRAKAKSLGKEFADLIKKNLEVN